MTSLSGWIPLAAGAALLGAVACGPSNAPSDELARDLELAGSSGGLALSPSTGRREVVSDIERAREAMPAPAPHRRSVTTRMAPRSSVMRAPVVPDPKPEPVVEGAPEPAVTPAPRPRPAPVPHQSAPPGGYKTVDEIIRDAPFPINP